MVVLSNGQCISIILMVITLIGISVFLTFQLDKARARLEATITSLNDLGDVVNHNSKILSDREESLYNNSEILRKCVRELAEDNPDKEYILKMTNIIADDEKEEEED